MNEADPKPLPMKAIAFSVVGLFLFLTLGFLVVPAFFDTNPMGGALFEKGPAPWAVPEAEQAKFSFTESQAKGRYHFQQYCASCHGPEGRGNGPASQTLSTRPPNFLGPDGGTKNGLAKEGIVKTLQEGIRGTEMPSFADLPADVKNDVTEYIVYLNSHPSMF